MMSGSGQIMIGWASADLTPEETVAIRGQMHARVSEGVDDPVTATALAMESDGEDGKTKVVFVSCDLVSIPDCLRDRVREAVAKQVPDLSAASICLNATHTHTGPQVPVGGDAIRAGGGGVSAFYGVELPVMEAEEYLNFIVARITAAVTDAWQTRAPGKVGFGLDHAVVGYNRRVTYENGESRMYGHINTSDFSHVEGYEDHSVNIFGTWSEDDTLTGLVVNVACPAQVSEQIYRISADYWHETRNALRQRLGDDIFVLPQCSAAGDQSPHLVGRQENPERNAGKENAESRMWRLTGRNQRQDIGERIADAVAAALPYITLERTSKPLVRHCVETCALSMNQLTEQDVKEAKEDAAPWQEKYETLKKDLEAHPEKRQTPRWYTEITKAYRKMKWLDGVEERYQRQKTQPKIPVEVQVLRIGDMVFATDPFEYYLDFGMQIKARSKAVQTFLVQLAGAGTYVPTQRSVAGGSYGSVPASNPVGPKGGRELVDKTVELIDRVWDDRA